MLVYGVEEGLDIKFALFAAGVGVNLDESAGELFSIYGWERAKDIEYF